MAKVKRYYGVDRPFGDIIHDKKSDETSARIFVGALGMVELIFSKRDDGLFNISKVYYKERERKFVSLGQSFPVKNKKKELVEGLSQFPLALLSSYDKDLESKIMSNEDCLILTIHKLKKQIKLGENQEKTKVGYLTGKFAIEMNVNETPPSNNEKDQDEIPF